MTKKELELENKMLKKEIETLKELLEQAIANKIIYYYPPVVYNPPAVPNVIEVKPIWYVDPYQPNVICETDSNQLVSNN